MFDTLKRLILPTATLHCPKCEKSLTDHDEAACARRMSRRFFFQVAAGAAVVVATPKLPTGGLFDPVVDLRSAYANGAMLDIAEFQRQFIIPAVSRIAADIDRAVLRDMEWNMTVGKGFMKAFHA